MPHSSGGGSHGGGFHSSGGYHSSNNQRPAIRTSNTYFPGSMMFFYYDKNNNLKTVYSNNGGFKKTKKISYVLMIGTMLFLLFIFIFLSYRNPKKIKTDYNTDIILSDTNDVFTEDEEEELKESMSAFLDKTGITPAIYTISTSDYKKNYSSLEDYAYNKYLSLFNDEKHWLIVYSSEANTVKDSWAFEGMQGDETDDIITEDAADKFNKIIYNGLKNSDERPGMLINSAFDKSTNTIMKSGFHFEIFMIVIFVVLFLVFAFFLYAMIANDIMTKKIVNKDTGLDPNSTKAQCPYCGAYYFVGFGRRCPKCNSELTEFNNPDNK